MQVTAKNNVRGQPHEFVWSHALHEKLGEGLKRDFPLREWALVKGGQNLS
jgi:hypothetical protein